MLFSFDLPPAVAFISIYFFFKMEKNGFDAEKCIVEIENRPSIWIFSMIVPKNKFNKLRVKSAPKTFNFYFYRKEIKRKRALRVWCLHFVDSTLVSMANSLGRVCSGVFNSENVLG